MTTIDIYARVSRASDKRDRSPAGQVADCKLLLTERGYEVGEVHIDSSKSAWNKKVVRPAWNQLMARLDASEADGVIVFELSRFTRRSEEGLRLLRLAEAGVLVMDSEGEYDLTKPKQAKDFRNSISDAEYESAMIAKRTQRGKRAKVRDNREYNCAQRPFGFEPDSITPRESEADELRSAARRLLKGDSALAICADLNARGVLTTWSKPWKPPGLRAALIRPSNVGDVAYKGTVMHVGRYPGILDRDVYDQLIALYAGRHRGRPVANLATGFVMCRKCERTLNAKHLYRTTITNPDGTPVKSYACVRGDGGCGQQIDWFDLNNFVMKTALAILCDPKHAEAIEAQAHQANTVGAELETVKAKIAELEETAETVAARWGRGDISQTRHDATVKPLDQQLAKLYARKATLIETMPARVQVAKLESRATWERRWRTGDNAARRAIVKAAFGGRIMLVSPGSRHTPARERCSFGVQGSGRSSRLRDVAL